jgi:hypothetical protein
MLAILLGLALATPPAAAPPWDLAVQATGFEAWEGARVGAALVSGEGRVLRRGSSAIRSGAFVIAWADALPARWSLAWWLDQDEDGTCDPGEPAYLVVLEDTFADVELTLDPARAEGDRNPYACDVAEGR